MSVSVLTCVLLVSSGYIVGQFLSISLIWSILSNIIADLPWQHKAHLLVSFSLLVVLFLFLFYYPLSRLADWECAHSYAQTEAQLSAWRSAENETRTRQKQFQSVYKMKRFSPSAAAAANQAAFIAITQHKSQQPQKQQSHHRQNIVNHQHHHHHHHHHHHNSSVINRRTHTQPDHSTMTSHKVDKHPSDSHQTFQLTNLNPLLSNSHLMPLSHHHSSAYPHPLSLAAPPLAFGSDQFSANR